MTCCTTNPLVVETSRLAIGASIFLIDVRADGGWQPFAAAPVRLCGWALQGLSVAPPADNVEAAVPVWAQQHEPYGRSPTTRRMPSRGPGGTTAPVDPGAGILLKRHIEATDNRLQELKDARKAAAKTQRQQIRHARADGERRAMLAGEAVLQAAERGDLDEMVFRA